MSETTWRRLVALGLCVLSIGIFGVGINWGLPSHQIDPILFGAGAESATNSVNAYELTGAGIDRLAGDWDESGNVAADVALHPIGDRSRPVTILENLHGATALELIRAGDQKLAGIQAALDDADRQIAAEGASAAKLQAAADRAMKAQRAIHEYLKAYNERHFPALAEAVKLDAARRARILRRYRLYSYQPDEMITFRALAMMHPGKMDFDPKLYQYGGLWIYPVGAILKAASLVNYVTLSNDRAFYLDSPESFGRFYVLARAYSAAWGIAGMLAVFAIVRRIAGGLLLPASAAICFICMPVVVDLAHEAKPHLAGTAILLMAILAAMKYVETGRWKWIIWTAVACGAAAGMVLSGIAGVVILPVMALMRRDRVGRFVAVCFVGIAIAGGVYFATNPYVAIHLAGSRAVLESNFSNTRAMYRIGPIGSSLINAARLVALGMSWPLAIVGVISLLFVGRREMWFLATIALVIFAQFALYAWNKPGEYARFALFVDVTLMVAAFLAIARLPIQLGAVVAVLFVGSACVYSFSYERGFWRDSSADDSRVRAGVMIDARLTDSNESPNLYVLNEPAPYCVPPVNLFRWHMVLLPPGGAAPDSGALVRIINPVDVFDPSASPISWADKAFEVVAAVGK